MLAGNIVAFNINFTYVVRIMYIINSRSYKACSSAAIASDVILTAAHCVVDKPTDEVYASHLKLTVIGPRAKEKQSERLDMMGVCPPGWRMSTKIERVDVTVVFEAQVFAARAVYVHPNYRPSEENDITLIRSRGALPVTPISVQWGAEYTQENCVAAGFGARYFQPFHANLNTPVLSWISYQDQAILPQNVCSVLKPVTGQGEIKVTCVLLQPGVAPCVGDSGGPMICSGILRGLLSRGMITGEDESCGNAFGVVVYERVNSYKAWIEDTIKRSDFSLAPKIPMSISLLQVTITFHKFHILYTQMILLSLLFHFGM